jgi:hypothetical protein
VPADQGGRRCRAASAGSRRPAPSGASTWLLCRYTPSLVTVDVGCGWSDVSVPCRRTRVRCRCSRVAVCAVGKVPAARQRAHDRELERLLRHAHRRADGVHRFSLSVALKGEVVDQQSRREAAGPDPPYPRSNPVGSGGTMARRRVDAAQHRRLMSPQACGAPGARCRVRIVRILRAAATQPSVALGLTPSARNAPRTRSRRPDSTRNYARSRRRAQPRRAPAGASPRAVRLATDWRAATLASGRCPTQRGTGRSGGWSLQGRILPPRQAPRVLGSQHLARAAAIRGWTALAAPPNDARARGGVTDDFADRRGVSHAQPKGSALTVRAAPDRT